MRKIVLTACMLLVLAVANAQNGWIELATFPGTPRAAATGFTIGNDIYIGCGYDLSTATPNTYINDFWKYNITSDSWTQIDSLPTPILYSDARGVTHNGKGYMIGGRSDSLGISALGGDDVWEYDFLTANWTMKASLPFSPMFNITFSLDSNLYVHHPFDFYNAFYLYNDANDTWAPTFDTALSATLHHFFSCSITNDGNTAYIFGGAGPTPASWCPWLDSILWLKQPLANSTFFSSGFCLYYIPPAFSNGFLFLMDSVFYFGNGNDDAGGWWILGNMYDEIYSYNMTNGQIDTLPVFPFGPSVASNYFSINGCGYLICGAGGMNGNRTLKFCPDSIASVTEININSFSIYPNPAAGHITVAGSSAFSSIEIYNVHNSKLQSQSFYSSRTSATLKIDELSNGVYILKIKHDNGTAFFKKFVKQ